MWIRVQGSRKLRDFTSLSKKIKVFKRRDTTQPWALRRMFEIGFIHRHPTGLKTAKKR